MGFASAWLAEKALFPPLFKEAPDKDTGIIVVVPAYNEPRITPMLDSLAQCQIPECKVEVLIIINAPAVADVESLINNRICLENIRRWKKRNSGCFFRLYVFMAEKPSVTGWGVGLARKTGMDEAVRRYDLAGNPGGVIVNLDADCRVEANYFVAIWKELAENRQRSACSIYFEHPLSGSEFTGNIYRYITLYELHMRYYLQGLKYTGFPYAFHTMGSAVAVKALPYIRSGGMNRRKAGEDFYFIQKLVPLTGYFNLNITTVFPSPRESSRVPFGTGPAITRMKGSDESSLLTYSTEAFIELHFLFTGLPGLYNSSADGANEYYETLPAGLKSFIEKKEWSDKFSEIKTNTSGEGSFRKRFFDWFNMFRIVKFMNHVHQGIYEKRHVQDMACEMLKMKGLEPGSCDPYELLIYYRSLEKPS